MSFVAGNSPEAAGNAIVNHSFFPAIDLEDFRDVMRVDNVASAPRARHALYSAMLDVNGRLASWMLDQQSNGFQKLEDAPEKAGHPPGAKKELYLRAVYSIAKSTLIERYRDYDTTNSGSKRVEDLTSTIDELRRDAFWAINDIAEVKRTTVELI